MALANVLLRRSSACLTSGGSQFCCRYLSTAAAAKRSQTILPTCVSWLRQFSSSSPSTEPSNSNDSTVKENIEQHVLPELHFTYLLNQIRLIQQQVEALRKVKEDLLTKAREEVNEKDPLLQQIGLHLSEAKIDSMKLPHDFEVECDKPDFPTITLKRSHKDEIINVELWVPSYHSLRLTANVRFSNNISIQFHCWLTKENFVIERITYPEDNTDTGVLFSYLPANLQLALNNFLRVRGVHLNNARMLYELMCCRVNRDNLRNLETYMKMITEGDKI